jgi:hypothetical protein
MTTQPGRIATAIAVASAALLTVGATEAAASECAAEYSECVWLSNVDPHTNRDCYDEYLRCVRGQIIAY